eukprot:471693-Ditylum_brightwellii.AAC.1
MIGDLDESKGGGRPYKSDKWADRLRTAEENAAIAEEEEKEAAKALESYKVSQQKRLATLRNRGGGTVIG